MVKGEGACTGSSELKAGRKKRNADDHQGKIVFKTTVERIEELYRQTVPT